MHIDTRLICYLFGVSASVIVVSAYPNGRTPPRPSDMSLVKATCEERSEGHQHEMLRARVIGSDGSADTLNVLIGKVGEQMAIARIKTLTLPSARVDARGFMKAMLVSDDDTEKRSVMVQVRSGKANLRLAGFRNDGSSVNIDLSRCRTVEFSSGARSDGDSDGREVMKK